MADNSQLMVTPETYRALCRSLVKPLGLDVGPISAMPIRDPFWHAAAAAGVDREEPVDWRGWVLPVPPPPRPRYVFVRAAEPMRPFKAYDIGLSFGVGPLEDA